MNRRSRGLLFIIGAIAALLLSHYPLLKLPFYWDELGQFIPAALDIYDRMAWVPYSTVPNVHPPGLMVYLALVWKVFGFSILHTRVAMGILGAWGLMVQWRLARKLTASNAAAWLATALLFCCPLFFSQSIMTQLDLPAMVLTSAAMVLFLEETYVASAVLCCAAVMMKETAIVAPALFGFLLLRKRQVRPAMLFALPLILLAGWLAALKASTGHVLGSTEFTDYNLFYPLHPVRLGLALLRRIYYLGVGSGHIIGTAALWWWLRKGGGKSSSWRVVFAFAGLHVLAITVLGGAVLERYLLPALPILYSAFAIALWRLPPRLRTLGGSALVGSLLVACAVNPPYPFPMENNLAWTTFVALQREASNYVETVSPNATIATTFPVAGGLRRAELGYVSRPLKVLEVRDLRATNLREMVLNHADVLVAYSTMWDPLGLLNKPWFSGLLVRFYDYVPVVPIDEIPSLTGMRAAFKLCAAGQCFAVFRAGGNQRSPSIPGNAPTLRDKEGETVIEQQHGAL